MRLRGDNLILLCLVCCPPTAILLSSISRLFPTARSLAPWCHCSPSYTEQTWCRIHLPGSNTGPDCRPASQLPLVHLFPWYCSLHYFHLSFFVFSNSFWQPHEHLYHSQSGNTHWWKHYCQCLGSNLLQKEWIIWNHVNQLVDWSQNQSTSQVHIHKSSSRRYAIILFHLNRCIREGGSSAYSVKAQIPSFWTAAISSHVALATESPSIVHRVRSQPPRKSSTKSVN
jgi:hypothetical protein